MRKVFTALFLLILLAGCAPVQAPATATAEAAATDEVAATEEATETAEAAEAAPPATVEPQGAVERIHDPVRKPAAEAEILSIASRRGSPDNTEAIEGGFLIRHGDFYYLFASFDACCRGAASTYNVRVGRASEITGPYVDRDGVPMLQGGGTQITGAYDRWAGPGHNGVFSENGVDWLVYHAYNVKRNGVSALRIEPITWDADGWPAVPSFAQGE